MTPPLTSPQARPAASPVTLSIDEVCARLDCRRTKVKELLRAGDLTRAARVGARTRVTIASVEAFEARITGTAPSPRPVHAAGVARPGGRSTRRVRTVRNKGLDGYSNRGYGVFIDGRHGADAKPRTGRRSPQ